MNCIFFLLFFKTCNFLRIVLLIKTFIPFISNTLYYATGQVRLNFVFFYNIALMFGQISYFDF